MAAASEMQLDALPAVFRYTHAADLIGERQLRRAIAEGRVERLARGVYRKQGRIGDEDLLEVAQRAPRATLCLRTALVRHGLLDDITGEWDVAIPRGAWVPVTRVRVRWRHFDKATFDVGRALVKLDGGSEIGLYSAERSIVDAFRLRQLDGADMANEALRRWLRAGGQPASLLRVAESFPRTLTSLRRSLEVLL